MKYSMKRIIAFRMVLAAIAINALFVIWIAIPAQAQSARAANINSITEYSVPGGNPWGTAFDSSGAVWTALPGCDLAPSCSSSTPPGKLALFDPTAQNWKTTVQLPAGFGQPVFVAVDASGNVWFTMPVTNSIGMYNPANATVTQWAVPTASAGPWDLAFDSTGKLWFTEHYVNQIGSFDPNTQTFHEFVTPTANTQPYGIVIDASNNVWFTENTDTTARIGEYTQGTIQEYKIRNSSTGGTGLTPHLIIIGPDGNLWWSEGWVHSIGTLKLSAAQPGTNNGVTEFSYMPSCSGCGSHTSGISSDKSGQIWVDDSLQNAIASFPVGGGSFTFYGANGHPHDGLNVDAQNRIWYDEEFGGKLAVAIQSASSATPTPTSTGSTPTPTVTSTSTPTSGTVLGQDSFQRANQPLWGTSSDGQAWGGDANSSTAFSISGNAGLVSNTGGISYSAVLGPMGTDTEVYATGSMNAFASSNFGDVLRWTDGNNWYKAYIDGSTLYIQKKVSGTGTTLVSAPFTATGGTSYSLHFRAVGTTLTANVWPSSGSEPGGWMVSASDSSLTSGYSGMRLLTQTGVATITSFKADVPGGSSTPTPTPTSTATATPTSTATATATATATTTATATATSTATATVTTTVTPTSTPTSGTVLGQDSFQRANQARWGTASGGQVWGGDANTGTPFSISGNAGLVSNTSGTSYSAVLGPTATNAEVFTTSSMNNFTSSNIGEVLRWTDGNNWYKAYIDGANLYIQKKVGGTSTTLASVPFTATAGTSYTLHFRAVGTTLSANVWASSGSEPSGWMVTANDSSLTSGYCGIRLLTQVWTATVTSFRAVTV